MVDAGQDLWRLPSPSFCLKQTQLEQVDQGLVQLAFEYLQRQGHDNQSSHVCLATITLKPFFLCLNGIPCLSVCVHGLLSCHPVPL